jgi:ATP-dependent Clp protease ATP-binding subunit ClpA
VNGYNFSQRVRVSLAAAREIAVKSRHDYVEPGHLLLGLLRDPDNVAAAVLANLGVDFTALARAVVGRMEPGGAEGTSGDALPYTSRAKRTLELAMSEARELQHGYIGTQHLLLGLLREEKGTAAAALSERGVTLDRLRAKILQLVRSGRDEDVAAVTPEHRPIPNAPQSIIADASSYARDRGALVPDTADMLNALVFSSREVAAVFHARQIDVPGLIDAIRRITPD